MDLREELKSAGVYPTGPCSAWPEERNEKLMSRFGVKPKHAEEVEVSVRKMGAGLIKTAAQAVRHGNVSKEIRDERYSTCKACPAFIEDSKRCSKCGCFMEAKTWVGGNPKMLCPLKKWSR